MEHGFIFLERSQRDFEQLANDSFFSHFTQTYIPTSNKLDTEPGRVPTASLTSTGCQSGPGGQEPGGWQLGKGALISGMCQGKVHADAEIVHR